uniref:Peptidase S26 n=2 Tax=Candidatus Berkiella aquae TaxID=295108 RepID=A0A0Q9YTT6_9GAMM
MRPITCWLNYLETRQMNNIVKFMSKSKFLIVCLIVGVILPFRFTITDSVTPRIFYLSYSGVTKKGDYILFKRKHDNISKFSWIKESIKQVTGVSGDTVEERKGEYFINGQSMGMAKPFNGKGQLLVKGATGVIPKGYLYVHGTGKNSLDSRYEAMGWIHENSVIARAIPIW